MSAPIVLLDIAGLRDCAFTSGAIPIEKQTCTGKTLPDILTKSSHRRTS